MGTTASYFVEYLSDAVYGRRGLGGSTRSRQQAWQEDHIHCVSLAVDKDYEFFNAIAGVRDPENRPPVIPSRGLPQHLSFEAKDYFEKFGDECAGWLSLAEIRHCIQMRGVNQDHFFFETQLMLDMMGLLVARLGEDGVRLVYILH